MTRKKLLALALIFLLGYVLFWLNYFGVLKLPFLTNLTQKQTVPPQTTQLSPTPTLASTAPKPALFCPVSKELCDKAREMTQGDFFGLGFDLPSGTPILTAFPAKLSDQPKTGKGTGQQVVYLRDLKGNELTYVFYGTLSASIGAQLKIGEEIGKIGKGSFPAVAPFSGLNFTLTLRNLGKPQKLSPADFGK